MSTTKTAATPAAAITPPMEVIMDCSFGCQWKSSKNIYLSFHLIFFVQHDNVHNNEGGETTEIRKICYTFHFSLSPNLFLYYFIDEWNAYVSYT